MNPRLKAKLPLIFIAVVFTLAWWLGVFPIVEIVVKAALNVLLGFGVVAWGLTLMGLTLIFGAKSNRAKAAEDYENRNKLLRKSLLLRGALGQTTEAEKPPTEPRPEEDMGIQDIVIVDTVERRGRGHLILKDFEEKERKVVSTEVRKEGT